MYLRSIFLRLVILLVSVPFNYSAKILLFLPFPIWSHYMQYEPLWIKLAERGHELTLYSRFGPKTNITNIKHIPVLLPKFEERLRKFSESDIPDSSFEVEIFGQMLLWDFGLDGLNQTYNTQLFKDLINSKESYDLVITEAFFAMESTVALGRRFNAPVIAECSFGTSDNNLEYMGNPNNPSYVPDFRAAHTDQMTFVQRFRNFYIVQIITLLGHLYYYPKQQAMINEHFGPDYPDLNTLLRNVSLTFLYTNKALFPPMPLVPNIIPIGGMHLKKPGKLPEDLQNLADSAKNGFIYVSFGSIINPNKLKKQFKLDFLNAFNRLNLTVFWKIDISKDSDITENSLTKNIIIRKWFPQTDLIAHPNMRLFITHGGISSIMEATSLGVPVLGIPFFGDQYHNLVLLKQREYGLHLDSFRTVTEEVMVENINTILNNPKFKQNAQKWSKIVNDDIVSPIDTAVYWIEYVIRHKGAHHLSSAARYMPWYQTWCVDIILTIITIFSTLFKFISLLLGQFRKKLSNQISNLNKKKNN